MSLESGSIMQLLQTSGLFWPIVVLAIIIVAFGFGFFLGIRKAAESRQSSLKRQRSVLGGMFSEQIAPYLPGFPEDLKASEARFIGKPVDFIIFKGMDEKNIEEVIFVEIKSGKSHLSSHEQKLKNVIQEKKVRWCEYRVDEQITALSPKI